MEGDIAPQAPPVSTAPHRVVRQRRRRRPSPGAMVLQVALIALGVFLGLAGEEWREDRENQRLAAETLQRFRTELTTNRAMVFSSRTYGVQALTNQLGAGLLNAMYAQPPKLAPEGFIGVLELYYDDLTDIEPQLLPAYDTLIAAIDEALAQ